jgi:N-methylhydantoinase B/oxoprolinase/acetone carboxylase alpha subunit
MAVLDPYTLVNGGANDLIEVSIPEGSILNPIRPAALSCRTHLLGRVFDVIQALLGQNMPEHRAAAGFSDSPHIFYSGFKPSGEFFLLYQIGFGGVPARPAGDGVSNSPITIVQIRLTNRILHRSPIVIASSRQSSQFQRRALSNTFLCV